VLERVAIFTDAQVAIRRLASEDPGPGQKYAIWARNLECCLFRLWQRTFYPGRYPVRCPRVAACCKLRFALRACLSQWDMMHTKEITKEMKKVRTKERTKEK